MSQSLETLGKTEAGKPVAVCETKTSGTFMGPCLAWFLNYPPKEVHHGPKQKVAQ